ncbi:MAG: hypothetical protein JW891_17555 [Candidatus Lokiarchaeota archaeon]|nr:hypothetical protein [Candidatus Lokiarchaeota archaeon]
MNKKTILLVGLISLMNVFLLSSSVPVVIAAPGDQGLDIVQQGDYYEFTTTITSTSKGQNYKTGEITSSSIIESESISLNITLVNKTMGMIQYYNQDSYDGDFEVVLNTSMLGYDLSYYDEDDDGLVERYDFHLDFDYNKVIAGTWENYFGLSSAFVIDLEYAKGNLSAFDYSLEVDEIVQKITIEVEYQEEYYYWYSSSSIYNESVVYDVKRSYVLEYDNFVFSGLEWIGQYSINRIANATYLEDNDETILYSSYTRSVTTRKGAEGGAIPGYDLFTTLGLTIIAVFGLVYLFKRKRLPLDCHI